MTQINLVRNPETLELEEHRNGNGAAITRYAVRQGIELELVAYWRDGNRQLERCLKNYKNHRCLLNSKKHKPDKIIKEIRQ